MEPTAAVGGTLTLAATSATVITVTPLALLGEVAPAVSLPAMVVFTGTVPEAGAG